MRSGASGAIAGNAPGGQTWLLMRYIVTAVDSEGGDAHLVWESDNHHDDLEHAVAAARSWVATHPSSRVEVAELHGSRVQIVRLVTDAGVERMGQRPRTRLRGRVDSWMQRPAVQLLVTLALLAGSLWMAVDPGSFDSTYRDPSDVLLRVLGVVGTGLFGFGVIITVIELATGRPFRGRRST